MDRLGKELGSSELAPLPILMVILDGAGDIPSPEYGGLTPLEAARTPHLDRLAQRGLLGLLHPVAKRIAPESHAAAFALLGYNPSEIFLSRGLVETLGAGLDFEDGDLALRCDFATASEGMIVDRRAGRDLTTEEANELADSLMEKLKLSGGIRFDLRPTIAHRAVIVFRRDGHEFSHRISNVDPAYERVGNISVARQNLKLPARIPACEPLSNARAAITTAEIVNEFTKKAMRALDKHRVNQVRRKKGLLPANFLLLRDGGTARPKVSPLLGKYGLRGMLMADMPVEIGVAKIAGLEVTKFGTLRVPEAYSKRAEKALEFVSKYDLTFVHLKGPDEPGHDGDFQHKRLVIEEIDEGFFSALIESLPLEKSVVCVTSDHATPCALKAHSDNPVPLLVAGGVLKPDGSRRFTEGEAAHGSLGTVEHGWSVIEMLVKAAKPSDRVHTIT